ncbi:hypothetical protein L596_005198 [Steinernema carpocapsae]|uniref:Maestro-like HEAT-repeats domain-containing protein n=1 Tax=Steinernema carpocapsae TaxID=34508 RepID=A0A4U8UZT4_STECR|nr:hypothetical protein L596_005198 [Steinernema carpocapsae]
MCSILGRLSPRLADSPVRHAAAHCLHAAFELDRLHKGHTRYDCDVIFDVDHFINRLLLDDGGKLDKMRSRSAVQNIAKEIEQRLPHTQAPTYISVLFDMLNDRVSSSAAQLLTAILTDRGSSLHGEGEIFVSTMLEKMSIVHSCVQTYSDLLTAFIAFLNHQQTNVIDVFLRQPLPYSGIDHRRLASGGSRAIAVPIPCDRGLRPGTL